MLYKKAFKYRIYPTKRQAVIINSIIGCCRFVFNYALAKQESKGRYWRITEELYESGMLPQNNWKSGLFNKYEAVLKL